MSFRKGDKVIHVPSGDEYIFDSYGSLDYAEVYKDIDWDFKANTAIDPFEKYLFDPTDLILADTNSRRFLDEI